MNNSDEEIQRTTFFQKLGSWGGAYFVFMMLMMTFTFGFVLFRSQAELWINSDSLTIFFVLLAITVVFSAVYLTEGLRLKKKQVLAESIEVGTLKRKSFNEVLPIPIICSLLLTFPSILHSLTYFLSLLIPTATVLILSSHLFQNFAWKKGLLQPKNFFYGGIFFGVVMGIVSFILSATVHGLLSKIGVEDATTFGVFALLIGWIIGPVYMLVLWAFAVGTQPEWKVINSLIFLCIAVAPLCYMAYTNFI